MNYLGSHSRGMLGVPDDVIAMLGGAPALAFPVYLGSGGTSSGTGAVTPALPAVIANDIMILVVNNAHLATTDATLSDAQGFAAIPGGSVNSGVFGGVRSHQTLFWKRAVGGDASPTVADNGDFNIACVHAFAGCVTSGLPWDEVLVSGDNDGDTSLTVAQAGDTYGDKRLIATFITSFTGGTTSIAGWTNADLANVTEVQDASVVIGSDWVHIGAVIGELETAGSFGNTTATWTGAAYRATAAVTLSLKPDTGYSVDHDSGVAMPVDAYEYQNWIDDNSWTSAPPIPSTLLRYDERSGNLRDSIGSRTGVKVGNATYRDDVAGWATEGVKLTDGDPSSWFQFTSEDMSTTAVAMFCIAEINTAGVRSLFSLTGVSAGNSVEVRLDASGHIVAFLSGNTATSTGVYTGSVVAILAVARPGSSNFTVYVRPVGGPTETLTPTWAAPATGVTNVYLASGWTTTCDATVMRVEYWTGADADAFGASLVGEYLLRRGL